MAAIMVNKISTASTIRIDGRSKMNSTIINIEMIAEIKLGIIFLLIMDGMKLVEIST